MGIDPQIHFQVQLRRSSEFCLGLERRWRLERCRSWGHVFDFITGGTGVSVIGLEMVDCSVNDGEGWPRTMEIGLSSLVDPVVSERGAVA